MSRKHSKMKTMGLLAVITLSLATYLALTNNTTIANASASYTAQPKPMEFYFHNVDVPVNVGGLETKYLMNTTRWFKFLTMQDAYNNGFYKTGLAKSTFNFYLYPSFAGAVTIDGVWQVQFWLNSSAQHPVGFKLTFYEIDSVGTQVWDSGLITPTVTSSGDPNTVDVPVNSYNLATPLSHQFSPDRTLKIEVEINTGTSSDIRVWYDSPLFPSKAILPATDYARPVTVKTYAVDNSETNLFDRNWTADQRKVIVRAEVTDPFGGYDIYRVNMTLADPAGNPIISDADMTRTSDGQWRTNYMHLYEANWSYPETARLGNYTVTVSVIDNNGYYRNLAVGSFEPFIESNDHIFNIGIIFYYNPTFHIVDDVNASLPNAQVFITWPNGSMDRLPRYTDSDGVISLTHVLPADYGFTILWKDAVVKQTSIYVDSDGPYTIKTEVYQLTVNVLGNTHAAVNGAYVIVYNENGVGYGLAISDTAGRAVFKLPTGTYTIEAHFSSEYWLKVVNTKATESAFTLDASMSKTIILEEFPPPIWTTTGFWLIIAMVGVSLFAAIYIVYLSRRRAPTAKKRA